MLKTFAELGFPGRLIAVEGLDGSGKSTQIYLLKRWLELEGVKVFFSEWNSSALVKSATSKGKKRELLSPTTFSLIHATDFADRYERQLVPLLRAGYIVLCDRYVFTAFARDVVRGCPPKWVRGIYNFAALPDITFFFKAKLEVSLQRILDGRPQLKYFEAGMDLHLSADPYESFRIVQGADGSGRTTQISRLMEYLERSGHAAVRVGLKHSSLVSEELEQAQQGN